jgi:hypothetical protein
MTSWEWNSTPDGAESGSAARSADVIRLSSTTRRQGVEASTVAFRCAKNAAK